MLSEQIFQAKEVQPEIFLRSICLMTFPHPWRIEASEQKEIKPLLHLHKLKPVLPRQIQHLASHKLSPGRKKFLPEKVHNELDFSRKAPQVPQKCSMRKINKKLLTP